MSSLLVVTPPGPESDALCALLSDAGYVAWAAGSGAEAVGAARRRQPDVILMDPALSAMDRWHAVKRLNTDASTSAIPVLTLASDATSPAGLQRVIAKVTQTLEGRGRPVVSSESIPPVGARAVVPRSVVPSATPDVATPVSRPREVPPRKDEPITVVPAAVQVSRAPSTATPRPPPPRRASGEARILVVDDNALNRDMLSRRLSRRGYAVKIAEDGQQALDAIAAERFELVLLDWMMPGLSGIDVLQKVREQFGPMELPVIMATAKTEAEDIVEALRLEANDYVTKPLNFDVVNARIRTQLGLVEAHQALAASEMRFRALLENTGDMIVQFRSDGTLLYVSPASRTLLGTEPSAMVGTSLYEHIHPIDRRELEAQHARQPTLPPAYTFIARMQRQDMTYIWVETSCRVTRDADGSSTIQAVCRDVTEHMDRLSGDEPPLPLGGDIMAHPGWRGGSAAPSAAPEATPVLQPPPAPPKTAVVLLTLVDGVDAQTLDAGAKAALADALRSRLDALLGDRDG